MKSKRLLQIFVLLTLLFSPFGNSQPVGATDQSDVVIEGVMENQPSTSIVVSSPSIFAGDTATVTVSLNNVPAEGYTSIELTCYYSWDFVQVGDIFISDLFGLDPAVAISEPYPDRFVAAIAGTQGDKATTDGPVIAFDVIGLEPGQALLDCQARVSKGDNALTRIDSTGGNIMILGNAPTPTSSAAMRITIDPGQTTATRIGVINPNETIRYLLHAAAGQVLSINLTAPANEVAIGVNGPTGLTLKALDATPTWSATVTTSGDHMITLMALSGSSSKSYTLQVSLTPSTVTATPTFSPTPCDKAEFIADVNVPAGTVMSPGAQFTKTWRLKNVGTCTWTPSYRLALLSGDPMGAPSSIQLSGNVAPGETADFSLPMAAPLTSGSYRGYWIFQNSTGQPFGVGSLGNEPWFVDIVVAGGTPTPTGTLVSSVLSLTKSASSQTYSAPGQTITYTFTITNTGTAPLGPAQFTITDTRLGAPFNCGPANVTLAPNQSLSCSMNYTTTSADMALPNIINVATAAGAGQTSSPAMAVVTNLAITTPTPSSTPSLPTATPSPGTAYDFAANVCAAVWYSGAGQLPCAGIDGNANGFVLKVANPKLETGAIDSRPGILTFPQNVQNGYIQGFYPPFHVQDGDRFRAMIGCEGGATNCYVGFRLDYEDDGSIRTFWGPFLERYDGKTYSIDVDLRPLAGKDVKFVLTVLSAGMATGDRALWVGPIIYRAGTESTPTSEPVTETPGTPATPTLTATLSEAPFFTPTTNGSFTPTSTSVPTQGTITGQVLAGKQVILDLFDADNSPVAVAFADADGTFSMTAPAGTYNLVARAPGFLSAMGPVTVPAGGVTSKPIITLRPGDIDGNFVIDWLDAITIGINYNTSHPPEADLNNDGLINVLDLELLAGNYRKIGPVDW